MQIGYIIITLYYYSVTTVHIYYSLWMISNHTNTQYYYFYITFNIKIFYQIYLQLPGLYEKKKQNFSSNSQKTHQKKIHDSILLTVFKRHISPISLKKSRGNKYKTSSS